MLVETRSAQNRLLGLVAAASVALLTAGCAQMVNGVTETVHLDSDPEGAQATVDGAQTVTTPAAVELSRGDPHTISFHKDGYQDQEQKLTSSESGWVWGNILLGGISGAASDEASGAARKLSTDTVSVTLIPVPVPATADAGARNGTAVPPTSPPVNASASAVPAPALPAPVAQSKPASAPTQIQVTQ